MGSGEIGESGFPDGAGAGVRRFLDKHVQRGVIVPAGEHVIIFDYVPRLIYASLVVSGILLIMMLFILLKRRPREK